MWCLTSFPTPFKAACFDSPALLVNTCAPKKSSADTATPVATHENLRWVYEVPGTPKCVVGAFQHRRSNGGNADALFSAIVWTLLFMGQRPFFVPYPLLVPAPGTCSCSTQRFQLLSIFLCNIYPCCELFQAYPKTMEYMCPALSLFALLRCGEIVSEAKRIKRAQPLCSLPAAARAAAIDGLAVWCVFNDKEHKYRATSSVSAAAIYIRVALSCQRQ